MGSFLSTCVASRQTIQEGASCFVIPIIRQTSYRKVQMTLADGTVVEQYGCASSVCYPDAFWRPNGTFIEAVAEDYGQVTVVENAYNLRVVLDLFRRLLDAPVIAEGENTSHDVPFDFNNFVATECPALQKMLGKNKRKPSAKKVWADIHKAWEYMWGVVHEHRLFGMNQYRRGEVSPMEFSIILQSAYQALVADIEALTGYDGESYALRAVAERHILDTHAEAQKYRNMLAKAGTEEARKELRGLIAFNALSFGSKLDRVSNGGITAVRLFDQGVLFDIGRESVEAEKPNVDALFKKMKPWLEMCYVFEGMSRLNIKFGPIEYAGQDYDNEIGQSFAKFVEKVSAYEVEQVKARYDE